MLTKVGVDIPPWVIVGAPSLVGLAAYALYRARAVPLAAATPTI